jgi:hypothetical protein
LPTGKKQVFNPLNKKKRLSGYVVVGEDLPLVNPLVGDLSRIFPFNIPLVLDIHPLLLKSPCATIGILGHPHSKSHYIRIHRKSL